MSDEPKDRQEQEGPEEEAAAPESKARESVTAKLLSRLRQHWLLFACVGVIVAHAVVFSVLALHWLLAPGPTLTPEVTLGDFQFVGDAQPGDAIAGAEFQLHVSLLDQAEAEGRELLEAKKYRVQQQVEQLLRRAHGADFDDPALLELRRLLQETINRTLGKPVIEEVMVTDLSIERADSSNSAGDSPEMANGAPGRSSGPERAASIEPMPALPLGTDFSG